MQLCLMAWFINKREGVEEAISIIEIDVILVAESNYLHLETEAINRIPRDPDDWLSLTLPALKRRGFSKRFCRIPSISDCQNNCLFSRRWFLDSTHEGLMTSVSAAVPLRDGVTFPQSAGRVV